MSIPLSIILCDRGASGVPTTSNPVNLAGKVEGYEDTLNDRYGFETARVSWKPDKHDVLEWARADHLLRPMTAYSPDGRTVWDGFLAEIEIKIGTKTIAFSLKDMANRLTVRYSTPGGGQGDSATYSSAASQALFGVKDRVINASIAASAAASNQAQTVLSLIAFPRSKQPSSAGTSRGDMQITLTFYGWYAALDWLLTANTSTTNTATSTQAASLLTAYNAVNSFFSASTANIASTGVSDTEYIEPDTTYREKLERLLARGNSSQQPLAWGIYENRALTVATRASATPDTITYYESEASGQIRDAWQNIVDPWDVRPNAMALVTDLIDAPLIGAAETPLRKYVARVQRSVRGNEVSVTIEPDDNESIEALLTSPAGAGPAGTSERQAAIERKSTSTARSVFPGLDNSTRYDGSTGVWKPASGGTGVNNSGTITVGPGGIGPGGIDLGAGGQVIPGGGIITNPGGGNVDLSTGAGIGSAPGGTTVAGSSGTAGLVTKWGPAGTTIVDAVSGTDYAAASHNHAASAITSGAMATARLGSGTASTTTFLRGDSSWQAITTITPAVIGAAPDDVKYIVQQASSALSAEQALGALGTGVLKNTTTTGVLSIAGASDLPDHASNHASGGSDPVALAASQTTSGTFATARLGSGTASSTTFLRGDSSWQAITTITPAAIGAAPDDATYIVKTANSALGNEFALSTLATGLLKVTTTTGALTTATASDLPSHTHAAGDITSGTMATARLGSGTASSTSFLRGDSSWVVAPKGSGVAGKLAYWLSANEIDQATGAAYDVGTDRLTISAVTTTSLRCDTNGTFDKVNINASTTPTHSLQLTSTDDAAKSTTSTWTVTSDARTKDILGSYDEGLALLRALRPVRFRHNGRFATEMGREAVGLIAQEVRKVAPSWITEVKEKEHQSDPDGSEQAVLRLNTNDLIYAVMNAIVAIDERLTQHGI